MSRTPTSLRIFPEGRAVSNAPRGAIGSLPTTSVDTGATGTVRARRAESLRTAWGATSRPAAWITQPGCCGYRLMSGCTGSSSMMLTPQSDAGSQVAFDWSSHHWYRASCRLSRPLTAPYRRKRLPTATFLAGRGSGLGTVNGERGRFHGATDACAAEVAVGGGLEYGPAWQYGAQASGFSTPVSTGRRLATRVTRCGAGSRAAGGGLQHGAAPGSR